MIIDEIRLMLVEITGRDDLANIPADSPLLHDPVALDSLGGMRLLRTVKDRYGVDVAAEDLNLDSLASLESLAGYIADNAEAPAKDMPDDGRTHGPNILYIVDCTYAADDVVGDVSAIEAAVRNAVQDTGGGRVITSSNVVFDNGAVTLVMILAESHVSVHTWPESNRVAIDLFSCGTIDGRATIAQLISTLGLEEANIREIQRA